MNPIIRKLQLKILEVFSRYSGKFALSGGTALELFYLKHRFSGDLDFFSSSYNIIEIDKIISTLKIELKTNIKLKNEFFTSSKAKVRFYSIPIKGSKDSLKIDFVEDVLIQKPKIKRFNSIPVYDVKEIYFQKIVTITGSQILQGDTGKERITGRGEIRDIIDLYYLSKKILPLHKFMKDISGVYCRGLIEWYRTYSRQEFILDFLDFEVYDKKLNSKEIISYLDNEINTFMDEEII